MKNFFIIVFLLFSSLLCYGCEINNLNNNSNPAKLTISDIKQLIGVTYSDVEKIYGLPEKSSYYVNLKDLSQLNNDYITIRDFNHISTIKAYYNINNNDSYIILWYKDDKVVKSYFNETDIITDNYLDTELNNTDLKIDYNKNGSQISKKINLDKLENYIGKDFYTFNKDYNLICPKIAVNLSNKNKTLYFYDVKIQSYKNNHSSLYIVCDNNIIREITIIQSSKICESIITYVNKNLS